MLEKLLKIKDQAIAEIKKTKLAGDLKQLETKYLGRKGELTQALRQLKDLAIEEKPKVGKLANEIKEEIQRVIANIEYELKQSKAAPGESLDVSLPGKKYASGHLHPHTIVQRQLEDVFTRLGFMILDGPEVESEYYNFEALNIPATHPARDMQDTFYLKNKPGLVMRTQTSNQQVRALEKYGAPLRAIFPGRVYRNEATDARHETTFYQLEGLMVDKNISIANLIAVMKLMLGSILKKDVAVRLRPGYFPFVEPGFEVDISCTVCDRAGCPVCKHTGWVESIGSGLVHPAVLKAGGLDPNIWTGFAFGLGITRLVMLKYGIDDIRLLLSGDLRFINQF